MATTQTFDASGCDCCPVWPCGVCPPPDPIPAAPHLTVSGMADNTACQAGLLTVPDSGANGSWQLGPSGADLSYGPADIGGTGYKFTVRVQCVAGTPYKLLATVTVSTTGFPTASDYDQFAGDGLVSTPGNSCSPLNIVFTNVRQTHSCLAATNVAYPGASWTLTA
jgi:hypothetical protein